MKPSASCFKKTLKLFYKIVRVAVKQKIFLPALFFCAFFNFGVGITSRAFELEKELQPFFHRA